MFYADPTTVCTYSDGSRSYMTPFPFASWAKFSSVLCEDGKRRTAYVTAEPDTFFSVPSRVSVRKNGKRYTVAGFVSFRGEVPVFTAYSYRKNGHVLRG